MHQRLLQESSISRDTVQAVCFVCVLAFLDQETKQYQAVTVDVSFLDEKEIKLKM